MVNSTFIDTPITGKDIKLVISSYRAQEIQKVLESRPKVLGRVRGYEFKGAASLRVDRGNFVPPVYDLSEIARASDIEPYINQSIRKHREQVLKEGYLIEGADDEMVAYVKKRLFEIFLVTGVTTEQWLREIVTNLIMYHNAFLIIRRDARRSSGKPIAMYGKELDPIAGIFVGDPTTMEVVVDKYGAPKKWRQHAEGINYDDTTIDKTFNPEDVIIITIDKKTGYTFGTPFILSALDDIRALRKLEEVAIIVSSKEAFPLYHYKVGTENRPAIVYEGGGDEVNQVIGEVQNLPSQGYIVTSERHEVKLVSKEGASLDLSPYLDYFESRVIAGLRLSPLDLGRGGTTSRGTATNLNKSLQDSAKDYQQVISDHLTYFLITPMLLEGGYDVTQDNLVRVTFPTIDREEERAAQNHGLQLYMGNAITIDEFRKTYLNRQPMSDEEETRTSLFKNLEGQKELLRIQGQNRAAGSTSSTNSADPVVRQITNRGQPANQHGVKPAKSRFKANDYVTAVRDSFDLLKNQIVSYLDETEIDTQDIENYFREFVARSSELSKDSVNEAILDGYIKARKQYSLLHPDEDFDLDEVGERAKDRFFSNFIVKSYWKVITPFKDQIFTSLSRDQDGNIDVATILSCLSLLQDRINLLTSDQLVTSERFGFIKFAKKVSSKAIDLVNPITDERIELDISELIYKNFVPTEETSSYFLSFKKNEK
jgi:hypothetical protein